MAIHHELTGTQVHVSYRFSYADAAARTGATVTAADVGTFALQVDDSSIWHLESQVAGTPTWGAVKSPSIAAAATYVGALAATTGEVDAVADVSAGGVLKVKRLAISSTPTGAEQDTGWDLPTFCIVLDVILLVTVQEEHGSTAFLDIGLLSSESGGDTDGFAVGLNCGSPPQPLYPDAGYTTGANATYASGTTRGVLLQSFAAGADVAGREGVAHNHPYPSYNSGAKSVVYQASAIDWADFRGTIYIIYAEFA